MDNESQLVDNIPQCQKNTFCEWCSHEKYFTHTTTFCSSTNVLLCLLLIIKPTFLLQLKRCVTHVLIHTHTHTLPFNLSEILKQIWPEDFEWESYTFISSWKNMINEIHTYIHIFLNIYLFKVSQPSSS